MLVVIAFHRGDYGRALNLVSWMSELGVCPTHSCLLIASLEITMEECKAVNAVASKCFPVVHVIAPSQTRHGWPAGPNYMFGTALCWIAKHPQSFFWCEPDCIPLKKGWLDLIESGYIRAAKPFMGAIFDNPRRHLNGCAVYPANIKRFNPAMANSGTIPFDLAKPEATLSHAHITPLVQHVWGDIKNNIAPVFNSYACLSAIKPGAVVFHRCKDGSLIERLRELRRSREPRSWLEAVKSKLLRNRNPEITVVITNHHRPHFLKEAFNSAVEAGASHIVVSSSSATPEIESIHQELKRDHHSVVIVSEREDSGCNLNWLAGIKAAPSEWVTILHDDDLLLPQFKMVEEEIEDGVGFVLWDARRHGMGFSDILPVLDLPTGIYSSRKLLRNLMIKDNFTLSPTIGCFRRDDLIETLKEAQANFQDGFHLTPTMMVGNDLLIWLRAISKHRFFKYIKAPLTSYGHHQGSTTCDEVFQKRGRLAPIYNRTRDYFLSTQPRIMHVVSRYEPTTPEVVRRIKQAAQSWHAFYDSGMVEPVHVWNTQRDSRLVQDIRGTHFLKDVLWAGMEKAGPRDCIMFTNDDSVLHPDLLWFLLDFMLDEQACCAFRKTFLPGHPPNLKNHHDFPSLEPTLDWGRDLFCFSKDWLEKYWDLIPDYLLGSTDFDSTLATIIRMTKGIKFNQEEWLKPHPRCELPNCFVYHEAHTALWSTHQNRTNLPGNIYNRKLTKEFISLHGVGCFVEVDKNNKVQVCPVRSDVIPMVTHLDVKVGMGAFAVETIHSLMKLDHKLDIYPASQQYDDKLLSVELKSLIRSGSNPHFWNFILYPCIFQPADLNVDFDKRTAWFSMWETTSLNREDIDARGLGAKALNRCTVVIVPCAWNASVFASSGVTVPIRVCPLGFDVQLFKSARYNFNQPIVFGSAAKTGAGGVRKGLQDVILAFRLAFPNEKDARLCIKCFPEDPALETNGDSRIVVLHETFNRLQLVEWYKLISVFVSGSSSEGWGRHQHESMAMGKPVIGVDFGGVTEFFNAKNGYPVEFTMTEAQGCYLNMGHYAKPSIPSMAQQMRRAYEDRGELEAKSELSSKNARKFTLEHSAKTLVSILREFEFL